MDLQSRQQFQCVHCNRKFRRRHSLTDHLRKYVLLFTCTLCNKSMCWIRSLRFHLRNHFQKGNICTLCNRSYIHLHTLKVHLLQHVLVESYPYTCRVCNKIYLLERSFRCHQLAHLQKKFYQCESCGKKFSKLGFQRHKLADCHKPQYTCLDCNNNFKTLKYMKQHLNLHIKPSVKQVLPLSCELCFKIFRSRSGLHKHKVCHTKNICTGCQRSFAHYKSLQFHRLQCHLYKCLDCNMNFNSLFYTKKHMNSHIKPSGKQALPLRCELCFKIFRSRSELNKHKVCHIKTKERHICTGCHRSFAHYKRLQLHQRLHCHVYKCLDCNKNLNSPYYMKQHMNSHINSSVPILKCESCSDTFRSQAYLHVHKVFFCKYKGTQGTANQSSQSIGSLKIQNGWDSNKYKCYQSQPKKNNNYGTSSQPKSNTDIPIESHNFTDSRNSSSDVVFQCQQKVPGMCPTFYDQKFEGHCDLKKHIRSHINSPGLICKYNTFRVASESNQSMAPFNMHKDVHLNGCPPKQIQIHQQAFRSRGHNTTVNTSAMRITSKNQKTQLYYCQICLQTFVCESDLKGHLLLHGANEWQIHGQNYYIFPFSNENVDTSPSLNNHIDRPSELTRQNQKLIEETAFPPLQWDAKAHVMPGFSSYGPDRVHNLQVLQHGPDRVHTMQVLQLGPDRVHNMQAPRFTEKNVTKHAFIPMIPMIYDHTMPYKYHNGLTCNRERFSHHFTLPQF